MCAIMTGVCRCRHPRKGPASNTLVGDSFVFTPSDTTRTFHVMRLTLRVDHVTRNTRKQEHPFMILFASIDWSEQHLLFRFAKRASPVMQDATDVPHDFQTLESAAASKRGCLATHLVVFGIGAVMGAVVNELMRQECQGPVPANLLHHTLVVDTAQSYRGERFFAGGPGENVLIPYVGRQPLQGQLLTTMQTAETFEISFDITPHAEAPSNMDASIVHFGHQNVQRLPAFWLYPGSTRLEVRMDGREGGDNDFGHQFACNTREALPVGQVTHVIFRLEGGFYTVSFNGQQTCNIGGFLQNRVPPQPSVDVWFSDPWYPPADVTVANLVYTSLYACGPIE